MKPNLKSVLNKQIYSLSIILFFFSLNSNLVQGQTIVDVHTANTNVIVVVLETDPPHRDVIPVNTGWVVNGAAPTAIGRSSKVNDERMYDWTVGYYETFVHHSMYLELNENLINNTVYNVTTPYGNTSFTFNETDTFCESIKVNQEGYSANATGNYANFGYYGGNLGSIQLSQPTNYYVVDEQNSNTVVTGTLSYWGNDTSLTDESSGEHVYRIDLSTVPEGGPYHIVVEGVGKSYSFGIGENYVRKIARVYARGMYHQRCGIALEQPYTAYERGISLADAAFIMEPWGASTFINVPSGSQMHPIIGGYHDAADFDRRPQHTIISITMLSTYEAFPDHFIDNQYNIPESGNGIPDFLDEALWSVKLWENLQLNSSNWNNSNDYGGIMQGTEAQAHPTYGVHRADAQGDLVYGTFEVGMKVTIDAAGFFAQASRLIQPYDTTKAADLLQKANLAWTYINNNYVADTHRGAMLYATLQMYLATVTGNVTQDENNTYHTQFRDLATFLLLNGGSWPDQYLSGNMTATIKSSQFISYLLTNHHTNTSIRDGVFNALQYEANRGGYMEFNEASFPYAQGVTRFNGWGASTAQGRYTEDLGYMMRLSDDPAEKQHYFDRISNFANYALGLNPQGQSYVTGLGDKQPISPLHLDSYFTKYGLLPGGGTQTAIGNVPGIVVYGSTYGRSGSTYQTAVTDKLYPVWDDLPGLRRWSDGWSAVNQNEFTTWETMVWNTCMYGVLYNAGADQTLPINENPTVLSYEGLVVYPNPTSNHLNIQGAFNNNSYNLEVFDVLGRKHLSFNALQHNDVGLIENINIGRLSSGNYFFILKSDEEFFNGKIVVD
ncbi:glycoside hydrolase family 9 protein [Aquimarina sp. AU474]|uniref:glycoside hydrolase family 9 protein n=1 Tax=Aquimarina sp. AU474 TaxID=2108529 RepID=UPI000D693930|nr:glycoside hydrolase family 9 protein [Aquimarina sp. AU474]